MFLRFPAHWFINNADQFEDRTLNATKSLKGSTANDNKVVPFEEKGSLAHDFDL